MLIKFVNREYISSLLHVVSPKLQIFNVYEKFELQKKNRFIQLNFSYINIFYSSCNNNFTKVWVMQWKINIFVFEKSMLNYMSNLRVQRIVNYLRIIKNVRILSCDDLTTSLKRFNYLVKIIVILVHCIAMYQYNILYHDKFRRTE